MQHRNQCRRCGLGKLPSPAPLANPYVSFQLEYPSMYEPRKALVRGTLYEGLDLPFKGMVNKEEKPVTPLTELQVIAFVIQDLALYLDTHRDDKEALEIYRKFQLMHKKAKEHYEAKCGPLNHMSHMEGEYRWLDDPWPWEYAKNKGV